MKQSYFEMKAQARLLKVTSFKIKEQDKSVISPREIIRVLKAWGKSIVRIVSRILHRVMIILVSLVLTIIKMNLWHLLDYLLLFLILLILDF